MLRDFFILLESGKHLPNAIALTLATLLADRSSVSFQPLFTAKVFDLLEPALLINIWVLGI